MKTRKELLALIDDGTPEHRILENFIDEVESTFNDISSLLDISCVEQLQNIQAAKEIVDEAESLLY